VRYVLEGSVRKAGNRVRVTTQLIEAATGGHLWAERYDRDLTDIFSVQDEITASVSAAILPTMERSERERAARKPPDSLRRVGMLPPRDVASGQGRSRRERLGPGLLRARDRALDPGFAAAQAAMTFAILTAAVLFRPQSERQVSVRRAFDHARRSTALDPSEAVGHCAMAYALTLMGRHDEAMTEADLAVGLDPNSALAHAWKGFTHTFGGRPREAIEPLKTAIRLSPFDPGMSLFLHSLGRAYYWMGDYPAAVATARQVCQSHPNLQSAYRTLLARLGQTGQAEEAQCVMAEALERFGGEFQSHLRGNAAENRVEDREHLIEGYRKAGVFIE